MTTTPEAWDDVGCLRLQVDCLSHKVEDLEDIRKGPTAFHGLTDSQLQELRDKVGLQEQGQKKERCLRDIIAVLFGCVLALLFVIVIIFIIYIRSTQKLSDGASEATPLLPATFVLNASGIGRHPNLNLQPVTQTNKDQHRHIRNDQELKQKPVNNAMKQKVEEELPAEPEHQERDNTEDRREKMKTMEFFEKMTIRRKLRKEAPKAAKKNPSASGTVVKKTEPEAKEILEPEVQSAQLPPASTNDEGRTQEFTKKDSKDAREDTKDRDSDRDSDEREDHEDGERSKEDLWNKPIDLGAVVPGDPAEGERRKSIKVTHHQPPPLTHHMEALPFLPHQSHGVVWVCFPASTFKRDVQRYAAIFIELARSQRWMIYPFCFIDVGSWRYDEYGDHFCDDPEKLTFVMEKSTEVEDYIPTQSRFDECRDYVETTPEHFKKSMQSVHRRTFQPETEIQASLVEDFLYDVYSGRVPEVTPVTRRDL